MGAFDVDLNKRLRTQRTHDDIAGNALQAFRIDPLAPGHFPDETVVEADLLDLAIANAISAAVAHMPDPGPLRPEQEGGRGCAHAAKIRVLLALGVNGRIRFDKRFS